MQSDAVGVKAVKSLLYYGNYAASLMEQWLPWCVVMVSRIFYTRAQFMVHAGKKI